jgi:hypothetical protein
VQALQTKGSNPLDSPQMPPLGHLLLRHQRAKQRGYRRVKVDLANGTKLYCVTGTPTRYADSNAIINVSCLHKSVIRTRRRDLQEEILEILQDVANDAQNEQQNLQDQNP